METLFMKIYAVELNSDKRVLSYATTHKGAKARLEAWTRKFPRQEMHIAEYKAWREKPAIEYAEQIKRESI